jgi:hypothetical protein
LIKIGNFVNFREWRDLEGFNRSQWDQKIKRSDYGGIYDYQSMGKGGNNEQMAESITGLALYMLKNFNLVFKAFMKQLGRIN